MFAGSTAASLGASSALLGSRGGLLLTAAIAVHEVGHYAAAHRVGAAKSGPVVLAPIGGLVVVDDAVLESDPRREIAVIAAGPLAGALLTWSALAVFEASGSAWALGLAWLSAILNVVNLVPVGWLDGGRLAALAGRDPWRWRWSWTLGALPVHPLLSLTFLLATAFRPDARAGRCPAPLRRLAALAFAVAVALNVGGLAIAASEVLT